MKIFIGGEDDPVTGFDDLYDTIQDLLGSVEVHSDGYKLARRLPKAHPVYPWLFATNIASIVGIGQHTDMSAAGGDLEAEAIETAILYDGYELDVEFSALPYVLTGDNTIRTGTVTWNYDDNINSDDYIYAAEWERFTDYLTVPANEFVTAQSGRFICETGTGYNPNGVAAPHGLIRMLWQKAKITFNWYRVPWSYCAPETTASRSYLEQAPGHVNQYDWYGWPAGTLLLEDVIYNDRTTALIPDLSLWHDTSVYAANKVVDIQFVMSYSNPAGGLDSEGNDAIPVGTGQNVAAGHNLFPIAHMMGYYYFETRDPINTSLARRPAYPSFPFELLFTDPES
jgi:hypothetical protein